MQNSGTTRTERVASIVNKFAKAIITDDVSAYRKRLHILKALHIVVHNECKNIGFRTEDATERAAISFYQAYISRKEYNSLLPSVVEGYEDRVVFLYSDGMQEHFCLTPNGRRRLILWNMSLQPYCVAGNVLVDDIHNHLPGTVEASAHEEFKSPGPINSGSTSSSNSGIVDSAIVVNNNVSAPQTEMVSVVSVEKATQSIASLKESTFCSCLG